MEDRVVETGRRVGGQMVREERRWKEREEDERGEDGKGGEEEDETSGMYVSSYWRERESGRESEGCRG